MEQEMIILVTSNNTRSTK